MIQIKKILKYNFKILLPNSIPHFLVCDLNNFVNPLSEFVDVAKICTHQIMPLDWDQIYQMLSNIIIVFFNGRGFSGFSPNS